MRLLYSDRNTLELPWVHLHKQWRIYIVNYWPLSSPIPGLLQCSLLNFLQFSGNFGQIFLKMADMSIFCGATDTPVLDFWWCLPIFSIRTWRRHISYMFLEIHLWWDTCRPLWPNNRLAPPLRVGAPCQGNLWIRHWSCSQMFLIPSCNSHWSFP